MTKIELKLGPKTFLFDCERIEEGVAINPVLPEDFDHTDNNSRPTRHLAWWEVPYIVTSKAHGARWCDEHAWPDGAEVYELRCLNGGAHDRSTWCGVFPSLAEALSQKAAAVKDYGQAARERSWALVAERKAAKDAGA